MRAGLNKTGDYRGTPWCRAGLQFSFTIIVIYVRFKAREARLLAN